MLDCLNLTKNYPARKGGGKSYRVCALCGVSLSLEDDTSYALVGESGSGKSTLARLICGIERPSSGKVLLDGRNLSGLKAGAARKMRKDVQLVLQDSAGALDPRLRIFESIAEPLRCLMPEEKKNAERLVREVTELVGLSPGHLRRLPHELSGGQLKRVCIARALVVSPRLIVFDESTSGLDVTVRKQILDLLRRIKRETRCTFLFITHDIDVSLYMADHVFVMKDGLIVESVQNASGFGDFEHEYSRLLISSLPDASTLRQKEHN